VKNILITGGAGFIGSHVARHFVTEYPNYNIVVMDSLTYAGDKDNINDLFNYENFSFFKGDIRNKKDVLQVFYDYNINNVIHLAAESHVDRSIENPSVFLETNILGTVNLLETSLDYVINGGGVFYHISTDEVYGSLGDKGYFREDTPYNPRSSYSASKASSDHFVRAYFHTYNLPILISNCSNNYGPNQNPEKMIPTIINSIIFGNPIPVYGNGENVRDWLWVGDHVSAINKIFHFGKNGETYNIGGGNEQKNIDLVFKIINIFEKQNLTTYKDLSKLITFVEDRKGHDFRYSVDYKKIREELKWVPQKNFETGLEDTINWYIKKFKK
jgi:dTDP-glucose 4,6-dehydratase